MLTDGLSVLNDVFGNKLKQIMEGFWKLVFKIRDVKILKWKKYEKYK